MRVSDIRGSQNESHIKYPITANTEHVNEKEKPKKNVKIALQPSQMCRRIDITFFALLISLTLTRRN